MSYNAQYQTLEKQLQNFRRNSGMISGLFWNFTHHRVVVPYRRFGTEYQSHLQY